MTSNCVQLTTFSRLINSPLFIYKQADIKIKLKVRY